MSSLERQTIATLTRENNELREKLKHEVSRASAMANLLNQAMAFRLPPDGMAEVRRPPAGAETAYWAIVRNGQALKPDGEWAYEVKRELRTDDTIRLFYFPTLEEAIAGWNKANAVPDLTVLEGGKGTGEAPATPQESLAAGGFVVGDTVVMADGSYEAFALAMTIDAPLGNQVGGLLREAYPEHATRWDNENQRNVTSEGSRPGDSADLAAAATDAGDRQDEGCDTNTAGGDQSEGGREAVKSDDTSSACPAVAAIAGQEGL